MTSDSRIEITIPAELLAELEKLAVSFGEQREHVILTAIHRFVADEVEAGSLTSDDELDALLKLGLDELDSGEFVSHEEVVRQTTERMRRAA